MHCCPEFHLVLVLSGSGCDAGSVTVLVRDFSFGCEASFIPQAAPSLTGTIPKAAPSPTSIISYILGLAIDGAVTGCEASSISRCICWSSGCEASSISGQILYCSIPAKKRIRKKKFENCSMPAAYFEWTMISRKASHEIIVIFQPWTVFWTCYVLFWF